MSAEDKDQASVKCTFRGETRVVRVRMDIAYNAFMLKVSEEFGVALVVDTYEDAEGEMITLGENGVISDLSTQLSFGAKHRPYALKIFLRQAGTKRMSSAHILPAFAAERRRSSDTAEDPIRPGSARDLQNSSKVYSARRRDSKTHSAADEDAQARRGSTGEAYPRRTTAGEPHARHSSAGLGDVQRRPSVDSDGDLLDEVYDIGAPWEPAFDRPPQGTEALGWITLNSKQTPRFAARGGLDMHVEIPMNQLHVNTMNLGAMPDVDPANLDTPGSASSALKTPSRVSPMPSPFNPDNRISTVGGRVGVDLPSPVGGSHSVIIVPARHADEPDYEYQLQKSMSSNGSSTPDLPSFHQQPFPATAQTQFAAPPPRFNPAVLPTPTSWRGFADSADIERELLEGKGYHDDSWSEDIEVYDTDRPGAQFALPSPSLRPISPNMNIQDPSATRPHSSSNPNGTNKSNLQKRQFADPVASVISSGEMKSSQERLQSPKADLRQPMSNKNGNLGRAERSSSTASLRGSSPSTPNLTWKKGDLLGRGGFGSVYKGLLSTGQSVAVKVLELPVGVDPTKSDTFASFLKEIDTLKLLRHPNIVRYIGSTVEASTINVFLEFVSGGSIASMISEYGPFEEPMIKLFAKHILEALSYLHRNNFAHRDIKGANILVDNEGVAKLADFGCSKSISINSGGFSGHQTMLGTPYWMAPEVMRQEGKDRRQADIWSFACTIVEMASGKPPWASDYTQIVALLYEVGNGTKLPTIPDHLSEDLRDLLKLCFQRSPGDRPTADQLLRHRWFLIDGSDDESSEEGDLPPMNGLGSFASSKKRSGTLLTQSVSASRSQALQKLPKSLEALPERFLVRMLTFMSPSLVAVMARTCAHFRFLAQRNTVWVALATNRWPKLQISADVMKDANGNSPSDVDDGAEVDFGKQLFLASLKYDRRFAVEPMYRHVRTLKGHTKRIHAMQFLEGQSKLITCSADKKIKIWEISTPGTNLQSSLNTLNGTMSPASSPSSSASLAGSGSIARDASSPSLSSSSSLKKKKASVTLRGHSAPVTCFYASSTILVSGSCDGMMKVWDMKTKKCTISIRTGDAGLTGLQFDEKLNLLVTSSTDGQAKVWELAALNLKTTLSGHKVSISAMKFHQNILATASADHCVKVWDLRAGTLLKTLRGHTDEVLCVDIVGDTIVAGAADGTLLEWNHSEKSPTPRAYPLPPSFTPSPITSVHFDGVNTIIAGREDGLILVYQYHAGIFQTSFKADSGPITTLTACNQVLATAGYGERLVKLWALVNP